MKEQAIAKIRDEMTANPGSAYHTTIGEYLLSHIEHWPEHAANILADGKTISKSLDHMREVASKKKTGNFAMLTPSEGFAAVSEYYGIIETNPVINIASPSPVASASSPGAFDISLDDLL